MARSKALQRVQIFGQRSPANRNFAKRSPFPEFAEAGNRVVVQAEGLAVEKIGRQGVNGRQLVLGQVDATTHGESLLEVDSSEAEAGQVTVGARVLQGGFEDFPASHVLVVTPTLWIEVGQPRKLVDDVLK